ncbi:MAG: Crp/Fnr family transcriptional regulator [Rhodospirillaceae bacterium]
MTQDLITTFPALSALDPSARRLLDDGARPVSLRPGMTVFTDGSACEAFLLVLEGSVRVQKVAENGREIVLYRVEPGQTCVLTTTCLLSQGIYGADGVTETAVRGVALAPGAFQALMATSEAFRRFVFAAYATRVSDLLLLIEEVAFGRIDQRLAAVLLDKAGTCGAVLATHQELAVELGSAREVISRQLKDFERRDLVALGRGRIDIQSVAGLEALRARPG